MAEEEKNENQIEPEEQDLVAMVEELKANSVSKEDYVKLQADNKRLMKALINNEQIEKNSEPFDLQKTAKELLNGDNTNLEYIDKALKIRKYIKDTKGIDVFVNQGSLERPTEEQKAAAETVAEVLQECVEDAKGDAAAFQVALQRRTVDPPIARVNRR